MHAKLLVLVQAESSEDAREQARFRLEQEGFVGEGRFSSSPADWFVVGGRWSGSLAWPENMGAYWDEVRDRNLLWVGREQEAAELFHEMFPSYDRLAPIERDVYKLSGYDDDAQPFSLALIEGLEEDGDLYTGNCFVTLDDPYNWVVVIDFHS